MASVSATMFRSQMQETVSMAQGMRIKARPLTTIFDLIIDLNGIPDPSHPDYILVQIDGNILAVPVGNLSAYDRFRSS